MPLSIPEQYIGDFTGQKGKAIRQDLATAKKREELLDLQIAEAKKPPKVDPKETRMQEKWEAEQYATAQDGLANSVAAAMIAAQENPQLSDQEYGSVFDAALVQNLGEEAAAAMRPRWDKNKNKILDPEERTQLESWTLGYGKEIAEGGGEDSPYAKINPKDFTTESVAEFERTGSYSSLQRADTGSDSSRQRDDEIRDATKILQGMGVPNAEEEATKQVDGKIVYSVDPAGGAIYRTDKLANGGMGKTVEVDIQGGERGPAPEVPQENTLWALTDEATGIGPGAKAFLAKGLGPLGGYTADATTKAKARFSAAENTLIRAFSLNPRYPVAEQNRIKENIQIKPKFWDSADQMHSRMSGIREFLEFERSTAAHEATRPGIGRAQKTIEENTVADIDRFLSQLGGPPPTQSEVDARIAEIEAELAEIEAAKNVN